MPESRTSQCHMNTPTTHTVVCCVVGSAPLTPSGSNSWNAHAHTHTHTHNHYSVYPFLSFTHVRRNKVNPALGQLYHDLHMFLSCALTDLTESTKRLEKARTEYRAALLWMKKESGKLNDPDNSGQLTKFRHVRGTDSTSPQYPDWLLSLPFLPTLFLSHVSFTLPPILPSCPLTLSFCLYLL